MTKCALSEIKVKHMNFLPKDKFVEGKLIIN